MCLQRSMKCWSNLLIINLQSNFFVWANGKPPRYSLNLFKTSLRGVRDKAICQILIRNKDRAYLSFKKDAATIAFAGYPKAIDSVFMDSVGTMCTDFTSF